MGQIPRSIEHIYSFCKYYDALRTKRLGFGGCVERQNTGPVTDIECELRAVKAESKAFLKRK